MTLNEVRSKYLEFLKKQGHTIIPSASLVPENDPTTLFTGSGMQPLVPYLLGKNHPAGTRLTNSQKCFRSMDIEEVGDNRHTTFFEMLGNWSFGDYFKQEQLRWFFTFLVEEVELDVTKLYVTTFSGDETNGVPRDTESEEIWKTLFKEKGIDASVALIGSEEDGYARGMKEGERIFGYQAKNWWSRAGTPDKMPAGEPGGPDSEVFYDFGTPHDKKFGENCHPNCDCGRFLEIGNSVFMEYIKNADGSFGKLPKRNVDFGGGLERIAAAKDGTPDVFKSGVFPRIMDQIEAFSGLSYSDPKNQITFRVIADHIRAAVFLIGDGVLPGNTERNYFVRRLIRRSVRFTEMLKIKQGVLAGIASIVSEEYGDVYPELKTQAQEICNVINEEEYKFRKTLSKALLILAKDFPEAKIISPGQDHSVIPDVSPVEVDGRLIRGYVPPVVDGKWLFDMYQTFGFPPEMALEEIEKRRGPLFFGKSREKLTAEFKSELEKHQDLSRSGSEQKFKGGLADTAEKTVRLHTAHHLLLRALQIVLGEHVKQRGSNITQERLRIDFSHPEKVTKEQLAEIERIVNEKMDEDLPVIRSEMTSDEAEKLGAEHEFGQKYPERVSVYSVGPKGATVEDPQFDKRFSIEFCGGPHVSHTGELKADGKRFKIQKEEAVAAGIRRIKAVLE